MKTRFTPITGIELRHTPEGWRHLDTNDKRHAFVGPIYPSKDEALQDHERYLIRAGWLKGEAAPEPETIDITPSWAGVLAYLIVGLDSGNAEGRHIAKAELLHMARVADLGNRAFKALAALEAQTALDFAPFPTDMEKLGEAKLAARSVLADLAKLQAEARKS